MTNHIRIGNKGEWSELYAFLRLLKDGKIYAADENADRIETIYFPITKFKREEDLGINYEYNTGESIKIYKNEEYLSEISPEILDYSADLLYQKISNGTRGQDNNGTFQVNEISNILDDLYIRKIKASSREKIDIRMQVHDIFTGHSPEVGFSIKSDIGGTPTLLNSGKNTRIKYRIKGLTNCDVNRINSINKSVTRKYVIARMAELFSSAKSVEYVSIKDETFKNNLEMIDSNMPKILGEFVLNYFKQLSIGENSIDAHINQLIELNPLNYTRSDIYRYKIRKLLSASALGMTPGSEWDGDDVATGGYIIIKRDGQILCYHLYNRNQFEKYLLKNTSFDRPSLSKFVYGFIYYEGDEAYIDLNFQIRFKHSG